MKEQQPDPDGDLVAAWQARTMTQEAFETFSKRVHRWFCSRNAILRAGEVAEDLTSETIRRVQRKIHTFRGDAKFFTWVIQFARLVLKEHYHKQSPCGSKESVEEIPYAPEVIEQMLEAPAPEDTEQQAFDRLAIEEARDKALTEAEREAFMLSWDEHLGPKEIAERLSISEDAAYKRRRKANEKVYRHLRDH